MRLVSPLTLLVTRFSPTLDWRHVAPNRVDSQIQLAVAVLAPLVANLGRLVAGLARLVALLVRRVAVLARSIAESATNPPLDEISRSFGQLIRTYRFAALVVAVGKRPSSQRR